jgi:hypothetical protein
MVTARHNISLAGSAGNGWISRRLHDQLRLLERLLGAKGPHELKEAEVARQVRCADTTKHPQEGLEEGEYARRSIVMDCPARLFVLRVSDVRMPIALPPPRAAGRVGRPSTAGWDRKVGRLGPGLDGTILARRHHDGPLAAHPRDDRRPIFVIVAAARLALLASTPRPVSHGLCPTACRWPLVPRGVRAFIRFDRPSHWRSMSEASAAWRRHQHQRSRVPIWTPNSLAMR